MGFKREPKKFHYYIPLFGIMAIGVLGFSLFSFDKPFQAALAVALCMGYVAWGIVHHYHHKDLYWEVVLEYLSIGALGLIMLLSVIYRA